MACDALAESTALIEHGLRADPLRLSRRRRFAALAVDVDGDVACTLFVVRGPGHFRFETHALVRRTATWVLLGGGGSDDDGLDDRPPARELGSPVLAEGGASVAVGSGRLPWGGRYVRDATLQASAEVHTVDVGSRVLSVPRHGHLVVVWSSRRPPPRWPGTPTAGRCATSSCTPGSSQPCQGGATPHPQRGTGASRTTSAPGRELATASRVPHST